MNRRSFLCALPGSLLLAILSGNAWAHTPYRQWKVMRQRFLLVHSSRKDPTSDEIAEKLVKVLDDVLPTAQAMVARARDEQRIASLLTTQQAMLAVMHQDLAANLYHDRDSFSEFEGAQLRVLVRIGDYRLLTTTHFPDHHAWLVTSALVEYGADAGVSAIIGDTGDAAVPLHDGAAAYARGESIESQQ